MSKAKHTPGPWRVELQSGQQVGVHKFTHCVDCADDSIASLLTKADAHLIAAAPDLLAACKAMFAMSDDSLNSDGTARLMAEAGWDVNQHAGEPWPEFAHRIARAAIAKAEGGGA